MMDVKEAIQRAKDIVAELFGDDGIEAVNFEEVALSKRKSEWLIVVSFLRPLEAKDQGSLAPYLSAVRPRQKKLVRLNASDGSLVAVTEYIASLGVMAA